METKEYMLIDGNPVEINGEKNLLELIRKTGIELPTFCYHSELSVYGACRMCMVENAKGGMEAACSTLPKAGMEIYTNTERLHNYRKMILELLLANHCRDCTTCPKNGECRLQELSYLFGIDSIRFKNLRPVPQLDTSSPCITRDASKCILCGDCVRMCSEIQKVGAIDFINRGSKTVIGPAFNEPIGSSQCVGCGQCAAVCPTGAIVIHRNTGRVWRELNNKETRVIAQVAPAVRVAMAKEFGLPENENSMGRITAALRRLGFDEIYDTATGADLTVLEESKEFLERIEKGEKLPLFTSCCPAWIQYCEKTHPELMENVSSCKSPMQMFSSIIKAKYADSDKRIVNVAVMPCTAKKFECQREEFIHNGVPDTDYVITTQELVKMIHKAGIVFDELEPEAVDSMFSTSTGAGVIFGVTGGVTEAVLRRLAPSNDKKLHMSFAFNDVRGMDGVKETSISYGGREVNIAVVNGLGNVENIIRAMNNGVKYDLIEVMACPGGCIGGGGQPFGSNADKNTRSKALYGADKMLSMRRSEENPLMQTLYDGILKGREHELLHVHYGHKA